MVNYKNKFKSSEYYKYYKKVPKHYKIDVNINKTNDYVWFKLLSSLGNKYNIIYYKQ